MDAIESLSDVSKPSVECGAWQLGSRPTYVANGIPIEIEMCAHIVCMYACTYIDISCDITIEVLQQFLLIVIPCKSLELHLNV